MRMVTRMVLALAGLGSEGVLLTLVGLAMAIAGVIWLVIDRCGFK